MPRWWIGTYDPAVQDGTGEGVYQAESRADGTLGPAQLAVALPSPAYLLRDGDVVHAALEGEGTVATIVSDVVTRTVPAAGEAPCHLTLLGRRVVVANYVSGTVAVLGPEGPEQVLEAAGSGPRPQQNGPHAHSSLLVDDTTLLTADLGADRVRIHAVSGSTLTRTGALAFPPGTGPRDLALLPNGDVLVLGELDGTLHLVRDLAIVASVTLPGFVDGDHASAIAARDGLVYCGVRGSNRIAVLRLTAEALEPVADLDCGGDWPRHLVLDGDLLHVANQRSHEVSSFRLGDDGLPVLLGSTSVPSPAFLLRVA